MNRGGRDRRLLDSRLLTGSSAITITAGKTQPIDHATLEPDRVTRLESEKQQLQHALGVLSSAVTFAAARLDQRDRREDQWRELLEANDEAKRALEATR